MKSGFGPVIDNVANTWSLNGIRLWGRQAVEGYVSMTDESKNHLLEILTELRAAGVEFIVCGGVAVALHGVERMTLDLDISLDLTQQNVRKFLEVMQRLGLKPRVPVPADILLDREAVDLIVREKNALVFTFEDRDKPYRHVDVFLTRELAFEQLARHCHTLTIGGQIISILNVDKLIELKERVSPPRAKDVFDIQELRRIRGGKI
ncbi:MAG: hypothetical protein GF344_08905 [Chitinivibrionales bacterium]|nr:hypothetical protein [Chitinivibrionales bacterium]MBD3356977.1 hypothetical protein [Chitinivibrionales bacterium]